MSSADQTLPGLDSGQQRAFENLNERHFKAAYGAAADVQEYIGYVLRDLEQGKLSHYASRVADAAGALVERFAILAELREVAEILKSGAERSTPDA